LRSDSSAILARQEYRSMALMGEWAGCSQRSAQPASENRVLAQSRATDQKHPQNRMVAVLRWLI
jgi:hypothetical protein